MDFVDALKKRAAAGYMPVIADLKSRSPGEGDLFCGRDAADIAKALVTAGAPALSVVTEQERYGGSLELLQRVCAAVNVPVLRKDFVQTVGQVEETASAGASAILLIAAMLDDRQMRTLFDAASDHGLTALIEAHSLEEIGRIDQLSPTLAGINNRDILSLETDGGTVDLTERLISAFEGRPYIISESGIIGAGDVDRARNAGADAVLVGTALLQAEDITQMYRALSIPLERG